jgi:hypothetical protein
MKLDKASATGATTALMAASIPPAFSFTMPHSNPWCAAAKPAGDKP